MNSWHDESIVQYTLGFVEKLLWEAVESSEKVEVEIIESFADDVTKKELARFNHNNILADLNEDYDQQNPVLTVLEDIEQDEDHDEYQDVVVFGESHCQRVDQSLDVAEMLRRRDAQSIRSPLSANMSTSVMSIYEGVERFDEQCSFSSDSYANVDIVSSISGCMTLLKVFPIFRTYLKKLTKMDTYTKEARIYLLAGRYATS